MGGVELKHWDFRNLASLTGWSPHRVSVGENPGKPSQGSGRVGQRAEGKETGRPQAGELAERNTEPWRQCTSQGPGAGHVLPPTPPCPG